MPARGGPLKRPDLAPDIAKAGLDRGADAGVDVVRVSRRAVGRAGPRRLLAGSQSPAAEGRGLRADDLGPASDCRRSVTSLSAERLSRQPGCTGSTRRSPACVPLGLV